MEKLCFLLNYKEVYQKATEYISRRTKIQAFQRKTIMYKPLNFLIQAAEDR